MKLIFTSSLKKSLLVTNLIVILLALHLKTKAQVCSNPTNTIYAFSNSGNILPVTVSTLSVGAAINPAYPTSTSNANSIGYNTVNGLFYYFQNNSSGASQIFVSFNPVNNQYTTLASAPITAGVNRGCVNFNGIGYYCLDQSGNLCYYNIATNSWVLITSVFTDQFGGNVTSTFQSQGSGDMAIDALGNLWIVSSNTANYGLFEISAPLPTTALASMVATQLIAPTTATPAGVNFAGIAFDPAGNIYVCTPNDLYLLSSGYALSHLGAFSVAGAGGDLTSCSYPIGVLPVTWTGFSAIVQADKTVALDWAVASQSANKGFDVEHSSDGLHWESIGYRDDISGNSSASYSFTDRSPYSGKNYYRIRQDDFSGKNAYSTIKTVVINSQEQVAIWPNPAKELVNIQQENKTGTYNVHAVIYNQSGQQVSMSLLHNGINTVNINALPAGYYIVHVDLSNGESYNQKLVKL